jgi:hypothetical protein
MSWLLQDWFPLTLFGSLVVMSFRYTGQWSLRSRLIIAFSRFVALVLILVQLVAVGAPAIQAVQQAAVSPPSFSALSVRVVVVPSVHAPVVWSSAATGAHTAGTHVPLSVQQQQQGSVLGGPSLSPGFIDQVLSRYGSPAAGNGWALYSLSERYGIDDAFALAFFWHESNFGQAGMARLTHSLGNLRCIDGAACVNTDGASCQVGQSCYASFPDWPSGFAAWYALIAGPLYVGDGRTTIASIIPRYAPAADNNDESAYIDNVTFVAAQLRAGHVNL